LKVIAVPVLATILHTAPLIVHFYLTFKFVEICLKKVPLHKELLIIIRRTLIRKNEF